MLKKCCYLFFTGVLAIVLIFLSACNSQVYLQKTILGNTLSYTLTLALCQKEENILNQSASQLNAEGSKVFTVREYFSILANVANWNILINETLHNVTPIVFSKTMQLEENSSNTISPSEPKRISNNLFFYRYKVEYDNPFKGYAAAYNVPTHGTIFHIFRYGYADIFPSFQEAFPFANSAIFNPEIFRVNYIIQSRNRLSVYGDNFHYKNNSTGMRYYVFTSRLGETDTNRIYFEFRRINPIGWYALSIVLGMTIVAALLLVHKLKNRNKHSKSLNA